MKDLTFLGVEFHKPVLLPLLKSVQVKLKVTSIRPCLLVLYKMQSSANNLAVDLSNMYSGRSFMNKGTVGVLESFPGALQTGPEQMMK